MPLWLQQVHGTVVADDAVPAHGVAADARTSVRPGVVCAVLTADCLPVLFCDRDGAQVAAAHAGWRGLLQGVLEQTLACFPRPDAVMAWLGPAIGPDAFAVGPEVRAAFIHRDPGAAADFVAGRGDRWLADLHALARRRLRRAGIGSLHGGDFCTYHTPERFFSYRRDGVTGRMASLVWRQASAGGANTG